MNHQTDTQRKNRNLLVGVTLLACFLHLFALLSIQGMKIHYDSPKKAWFEQQYLSAEDEYDIHLEKLEREEEIAELFNQLVERPVTATKVEVDSSSSHQAQVEQRESPLDKMLNDTEDQFEPLPEQMAAKSPVVHDLPFTTVDNIMGKELITDPVDLPNPTSIVVTPMENKQLTDDLIQATSVLKGEILVENPEEITTEEGIRIGVSENASLLGTALQNRSGFLDEGQDTAVGNAYPKIAPSFRLDQTDSAFSVLDEGGDANELFAMGQNPLVEAKDLIHYDLAISKKQSLPPPNLDDDGIPHDFDALATIASSDDFALHVRYAPKKDGRGYVFKLILLPKEGVLFRRIKQNMFFLLDRSHSIDRERYEVSKQAVIKALAMLNEGDTFNIFVFDDNVERLSTQSLPWNQENIAFAKKFLSNQPHGGFFASTDIYASLGKIVPDAVADTEVNTAILLSDGDTYLRRSQQRTTIGDWTQQNSGKVSLFSVASGGGNNLPLLELLSAFNKGVLVYSPAHNNLENTLFNLINAISTPIGKDISITAIPSHEKSQIMLYPRRGLLPDLYDDLPYVIYGATTDLSDFHIFLQGKYYDKWLDIKQKVSFGTATELKDDSLEKNLVIRRAYDHYYRFLGDGDSRHLAMAKKLLAPLNIQVAFQ